MSKGAVVKAEEFYKKMNATIPEELKGKFFSASDIKDFEKMKAINPRRRGARSSTT